MPDCTCQKVLEVNNTHTDCMHGKARATQAPSAEDAAHLLDVASWDETLEGAEDLHDEPCRPRTLHPDWDKRPLLLDLVQPLVRHLLLNQLQS